jgi:hypothetical protein
MTRSLIVAEGTAEKTILEILLANDYLSVTQEDLIEAVVPRFMKPQDLAERYLQRDFGEGIDLLVVLDSPTREQKVPRIYQNQVRQTQYFVTTPEIESVQLYANPEWITGYQRFRNRHHGESQTNVKPSAYFKASPAIGGLGLKGIKTDRFVRDLWERQPENLVTAILKVHTNTRKADLRGRQTLATLLRADLREDYR